MSTPGDSAAYPQDVHIPGEPAGSALVPDADRAGKGAIHVVHLYPREMSIYGDLGNTRTLAARIRRHGYSPVVHQHHPGGEFPEQAHLVVVIDDLHWADKATTLLLHHLARSAEPASSATTSSTSPPCAHTTARASGPRVLRSISSVSNMCVSRRFQDSREP